MSEISVATPKGGKASTVSTFTPSINTDLPPQYADPAGYLLSKGWKPRGDVRSPACLWIDPTKPLTASNEVKRIDIGFETDGRTRKYVDQLHYTAAATPVNLNEALSTQYGRDDMEAQHNAAKMK